ncbi:MAG TPA: GMC oxidoreductase [Gemmatimonadaceae bacterium]|nr:GMC oxidoreductase [Gemmatimonadaceae bacterium]
MSRIVVVGSGASGVHFALSALSNGHDVTMLDVGFQAPHVVEPEASFEALKERLDDPVTYFLGPNAERVVYPSATSKHFGFPASKDYVFSRVPSARVASRGFEPLLSFARGGLAEAWTGGCYEFGDAQLERFPISFADLRPHYAEVARRVGISAERDDIERFSPFTAPYLPPLAIDEHSRRLLLRYGARRTQLNAALGFFLGRSRVATLSLDRQGRGACANLGRCLWGCPRGSLYTPSLTLRECLRSERFTYLSGQFVTHFHYDTSGRVTSVISRSLESGSRLESAGDLVVLAAGALGTSRLYLESIRRREGRIVQLSGLMDNPHAVVPFVNWEHLGRPVRTASYQFHLLAIGLAADDGSPEGHGQITTLRAASVHPIVQNLPFDLRAGASVFRRIRSALGVANVWAPGNRRAEHVVTLRTTDTGAVELVLDCAPDTESVRRLSRLAVRVRRALSRFGCTAPAGMTQILPLGSSVHYAGTLPMTEDAGEHTCDRHGRVRGFQNLIVADGAAFPSLPATNLTFTLMANAARIAESLGAA